jgi:alkaline phosphatase D
VAVSPTTWNVLGQQVFFSQRDFEPGPLKRLSMDAWDGYAPTRDRLLNAAIGANRDNLIVLTGDVHANYACELKANYDDPASATLGAEFVGTSITSGGNGVDQPTNAATLYAENPHLKFVNTQRGYVVVDLTHERCQASYRVVPFITTQGAPVSTRASFVVENGVPGLNPA